MRLEALEKEADLYRGDGDCYIHVERTAESPITCIMAGDRAAAAQAVYHLLCEMSRQLELSFPQMLSFYRKVYKKNGFAEKTMLIDE